MSTETISQFIEHTLNELATQPEYRIPLNIIPQIAYLIEKYPSVDSNSSKSSLMDDLSLIIENVRKQGALD